MICPRLPRFLVALFALLAIAGFAATAIAQDKLDRALRDGQRSGKSQRVIVKAKPGYEAWARQLLAEHGKNIDAELPSIGALAVELAAGELDLCKSAVFDGCSEDSYVTAERGRAGCPSRLQRAAVNSLLGTLGLTPIEQLRLRRHGGVDRLGHLSTRRRSRAASRRFTTSPPAARVPRLPFDDYGHGTHVAGLIGGLQGSADLAYEGVAPSGQLRRSQGSRSERRRPHERRHSRHRVRHREQDQVRHRHHQPLARPSDLRTGGDRPAGAGGREGHRKAGIIVVASAGNHGVNDDGEIGFAGITSPGNAPSALTVGAADHRARSRATTTASRPTARTARRGTTASSSPTSSRPVTSSRRKRRRTARSSRPTRRSARRASRARSSCSCPAPACRPAWSAASWRS